MKNFKNIIFEGIENKLNKLFKNFGDNFTEKQKEEIRNFFEKHTKGYENLIDWNRLNSKKNPLTWKDFEDIIRHPEKYSKSKEIKIFKEKGIKSLEKNKDYVYLGNVKTYELYIPLTHKASVKLANVVIANCQGKWCTAITKKPKDFFIHAERYYLIYAISYKKNDKFAFLVDLYDCNVNFAFRSDGLGTDAYDIKKINPPFKLDFCNIQENYKDELEIVRKNFNITLGTNHWKGGVYTYDYWDEKSWHCRWLDGIFRGKKWIMGIWHKGVFEGEEWENGMWYNGIFKGRVWHNGVFGNGVFKGKLWVNGRWLKGEWKGVKWHIGEIFSQKFGVLIKSDFNPKIFHRYETQVDNLDDFVELMGGHGVVNPEEGL